MAADRLDEVAQTARRVLGHRPSGLCTDIDGTISPVVESPEAAIVPEPIKHALMSLAERLDAVVVVTGRGVEDARQMVGLDVVGYVGNHGMERWDRGQVRVHPRAEAFVPTIAATLAHIAANVAIPGVILENKRVTASIHYRLTPDPAAARSILFEAIERTPHAAELRIVEGRMVINLLPQLRLDKGRAVEELATEHDLRGLVFLGDDVTDIDAFRALRELRTRRSMHTLGIAVVSPEAPPELTEAADLAVGGVPEVALLLETLAAEPYDEPGHAREEGTHGGVPLP